MRQMLYMESAVRGALVVNGQFCGPVDREGQAFPCGRNAEVYIQLFPFGCTAPLSAALLLKEGRIERLEPEDCCFALMWPGGVIQLELRPLGVDEETAAEPASGDTLLRYLHMKLEDNGQAAQLWMRPQDEMGVPDMSAYHAAVPLAILPAKWGERFDERAGLVRRIARNIACVDAALAVTSPAGQGRRLIERMEIIPT